ncbi:dipeptidyl-peptidase 3 family protein [Gracilimonas sp. Q87]|uniref:dipeptidyl-peptidase 3 family protein n=1 Tax=Gracilimonas sp. Q87 TaxID=3384766 RepID=UPI0039841C87
MTKLVTLPIAVIIVMVLSGCITQKADASMDIDDRLAQYTEFTLEADLSELTDNQKQILPLLIEAAKEMEKVFWLQAYGDKEELLSGLGEKERRFAQINYGPWDRLNGNEPFIPGVGSKPAGANFYPDDMLTAEFEAWDSETKDDLYTLVRRDGDGNLVTIPYFQAFAAEHERAAELLKQAAELAEDAGFKNYLELRAEALLNDEYQESDLAWMDMKDNTIELVIGPIETYEDQLFGYKAAHEAFVLIKDKAWSDRLSKYAAVLPELQRGLPVPEDYKSETPGSDSDLNAYDAIYYAGDANAGSKTIAINLPNDEEVQLAKGTRRLQLKNSMRAKYDKILIPISEVLIAEDQRQYISFDAFFGNTMFHEVAHGLGIKNTVDGSGTVREALRNHASALEEGKADVLGLYMVDALREKGMIEDGSAEEDYVTFLASIFRSIRFGSSSAHGRANLIRFNYFQEMGAFDFDEETETYRINFDRVDEAVASLSEKILTLQGDGDYNAVDNFVKKYAVETERLRSSLQKLSEQNIPVDITFEQGPDVLSLN